MSDAELKIDEYQLLSCIASGGQTQIWEVSIPGSPETLAMKLLLADAFAKSAERAVIKHEAKVGKSLEHPNVLPIIKYVKTKQNAYLIMPLFRSANLKNFIAADHIGVQVRFRKLFESTCLALGHMHEKGWIHRDIKPDNILLNKASEVRLIDFSLSTRVVSGVGKLLAGKAKTIQGTRTYIAPETIRKQTPSPQTDMYSLGITMFEALTGRPPFMGMHPQELLKKHIASRAQAPSEFNPNVTPEMDLLIAKMLKKKPKDRPESMQEIYTEFRNIKAFREEVQEVGKPSEEEQLTEEASLETRLDSRTDHIRSEATRKNPELAKTLQTEPTRQRPVLQVQIVGDETTDQQVAPAPAAPLTQHIAAAGQPAGVAPPPPMAPAPPPVVAAPIAPPPMAVPQNPAVAPDPQAPPMVAYGQGVAPAQPQPGQPVPQPPTPPAPQPVPPVAQVPPGVAAPAAAPPPTPAAPPAAAPPPMLAAPAPQSPPAVAPSDAAGQATPPAVPEPAAQPEAEDMDWMEDLPDVV
ncbi:MAG: hypothetical protein CMJ48_09410 [Planctomycetaceae bacterium]|nr:hypothetical protein [Planctomycetaceae bacterium]